MELTTFVPMMMTMMMTMMMMMIMMMTMMMMMMKMMISWNHSQATILLTSVDQVVTE